MGGIGLLYKEMCRIMYDCNLLYVLMWRTDGLGLFALVFFFLCVVLGKRRSMKA